MNKIEELEYELAKSLILNFFCGYYYITFDNLSDVEEFLTFISIHDRQYDQNFSEKEKIKSVLWKYSKTLHRPQLEWMTDKTYFKKCDAEPLSYEKVKPYIEMFKKI